MQRSMPIITAKLAVISGFLLLGLLAVAVWLLASASPAFAQTDDTNSAAQSTSTHQADAQQATTPASPAPPPGEGQIRVPELPPLPTDLNALAPALPSVADVLPLPLQPAVNNVSELLPAPARAPIAPLLSHAATPPSRVDVAPGGSAESDANQPPGPSTGTPTTADAAPHARPAVHGHNASELRASDSSSHEGDTGAPSGVPSPVAAQGSLVSSSAGRDFGQSMLLFGVVAAGIMFLLGRGRRLWREATGWLPAPWCVLIERPG
jgi:hypothetical protein